MSDTPSHAHIKQEIDTTSCCSPAPSSGTFSNNTQHAFLYNNSPVTTVSWQQLSWHIVLSIHVCSNTTQKNIHFVDSKLNWSISVRQIVNRIRHPVRQIVNSAAQPRRWAMINSPCATIAPIRVKKSCHGDCVWCAAMLRLVFTMAWPAVKHARHSSSAQFKV